VAHRDEVKALRSERQYPAPGLALADDSAHQELQGAALADERHRQAVARVRRGELAWASQASARKLGSEMVWQQARRRAEPEHREQQDAPEQAHQAAERQRAAREPDLETALQLARLPVEMEQRFLAPEQQEQRAAPMAEREQRVQPWKPQARERAAQQEPGAELPARRA
jgi:hypothetical protein